MDFKSICKRAKCAQVREEKAMTIIKTKSKTCELDYGSYDLDDMIARGGDWERDEDGAWLMSEEDAAWWEGFARRQDRIERAYAEADDDTRTEIASSIGGDYEANQHMMCESLGIPYDE